jgi:hypothetical protein
MPPPVIRIALAGILAFAAPAVQREPALFQIDETTSAQIHAAMKAGLLTCHALVDHDAYEQAAHHRRPPASAPAIK